MRDFAYALANYQDRRGLWKEKLAWAQEGLAACDHLNDRAVRADMQIILGTAYLRLPTGDRAANLEQAIERYREVLRFRTPEAAPLDYAITQNNLGSVLQDLGDLAGARVALERALQIFRALLSDDHPNTVTVRRNLDSLQG